MSSGSSQHSCPSKASYSGIYSPADLAEIQANAVAARILMPRPIVIMKFRELSGKYDLSMILVSLLATKLLWLPETFSFRISHTFFPFTFSNLNIYKTSGQFILHKIPILNESKIRI